MPGQASHKEINHVRRAKNVHNETFSERTAQAQKPHTTSWYRNPMHVTLPVKYDPPIHLKLTSGLL